MPVLLSDDNDSSRITTSGKKSYYHYVHPDYPLSPYTLPEIYERAADRDDGRGVTWHDPREFLTHKQLCIEAMKYAKGLLAIGLKRGDTVVVCGSRTSEATIMFMACSSIGIRFMEPYTCPVGEQMERVITELEPDLIMIGGCRVGMAVLESCYEEAVKILKKRENTNAHQIKHIYHDSEIEQSQVNPLGNSLNSLKADGHQVSDATLRLAKSKVTRNEPTVYVLTSGSTGRPKLCLIGAALFTNAAARKAERYGITRDIKMAAMNMAWIELAHLDEVVGSLEMGNDLLVYPVSMNDDDEGTLQAHLEATSEHKPVMVHMDQWYAAHIVNHPECLKGYDFSSVKGFLITTACTTAQFKQRLMQQYPLSYDCYGLTEFENAFCSRPGQNAKKLKTVGKPYANVEAKLVDENMNIVPVGCTGELYVRGYCTFIEYHNMPSKRAEVVDSDEWFRTGDMAVMDEDMDLEILGRATGMERFKIMGDIIYVAPVEEQLQKHPSVEHALVVGTPLEGANGVEMCYCIVPKSGHKLTIQEMVDHAKETMDEGGMWPSRVFFFDKIPRKGGLNKVSRDGTLKEVLRRIEEDEDAGWTGVTCKQA